ncbi:glycosyltransferase [Eubacterium sp.]|mgnify:FL=1|uniref:glycosyltransferase n=1 Tax=Eubacterium sp. TaxID=142586 RepID=UPI001DDE173B|nr:glycosyltransferase [Eubacterium sp.]MBS5620713.1 glycosyltransferase [Eubacterium sp.]
MNILRLTPHYYFESKQWPSEYDPLGGMQTQITHLTEKLVERKIFQTVITSGYPGAESIQQKYLRVIPVSHFIVRIKSKIDGLVGFNMFWVMGVLKWIKHNKEKMGESDIIHIHYSGVYAPIFISLLIKKFFPKKCQVITVHCSRNFTFIPPNLCSKFLNRLIKKMEINSINHAKKVIVLTERQKENYLSVGIQPDKIEVIGDSIPDYHLIKASKKVIGDDKWAKVLRTNKKKLTYVGRISFEKGCERLINIAEKLKREDVIFLVIGDGPQKKMLLDQIRERKLEKKFVFSGFISRMKIPYILQNTDVLLVPSRHEEFGGIVIEGVAANVPIVTTGVGGITRILGEDYNGIVGDNVERFCEKINMYLDGKKQSEYNRDEIIKRYNCNSSIDRICEIYKKSCL